MSRNDWEDALNEVNLPQPAPGKKIISFTLPVEDIPAKPKPRRKKAEPISLLSPEELEQMNAEDYAELSTTPRRRAREAALLLLFAADKGCDWPLAENILADVKLKEENSAFARELAATAFEQRAHSDELLTKYAREWDVSRFSSVDLAVLRLAVAELFTAGENVQIIINEAIELAKKFGSEESASFVNGILDTIYNQEVREK